MKKILLFLCVISVVAMMTSCLRRSDGYDEWGFVFIAQSENGMKYGRTANGRAITNNHIQAGEIISGEQITYLDVGNFFFFRYMWNEETDGRTSLGESRGYADNANIVSQVIPINRVILNLTPAPEGAPEERFYRFSHSVIGFPEAWRWNDHWIVGFQYIGGVGMPEVTFYKRGYEIRNNTTYIEIDVRISNIPQVTPPQQTIRGGHDLALDMSDIRRGFQQETDRNMRIRFHYYQGQEVAIPRYTPWTPWTLTGTAQQQ